MPVDEITSDEEALKWAKKGSAELTRIAHSSEVPYLPDRKIKDYLYGIRQLCSKVSEQTRQELWPYHKLWQQQLQNKPEKLPEPIW